MSDDNKCPVCGGSSGFIVVKIVRSWERYDWSGEAQDVQRETIRENKLRCADCARVIETDVHCC